MFNLSSLLPFILYANHFDLCPWNSTFVDGHNGGGRQLAMLMSVDGVGWLKMMSCDGGDGVWFERERDEIEGEEMRMKGLDEAGVGSLVWLLKTEREEREG